LASPERRIAGWLRATHYSGSIPEEGQKIKGTSSAVITEQDPAGAISPSRIGQSVVRTLEHLQWHSLRILRDMNKALEQARDVLLPKLMNGEIAV
jgi:hypothetical protein